MSFLSKTPKWLKTSPQYTNQLHDCFADCVHIVLQL